MQALRLIKNIVINGKDLLGRKAWIKFSSCDKRGWYWKCRGNIIPITSEIATHKVNCKFSRIVLKYKNESVHFYEHIAALRATGLTGIVIESSAYPPYHGRPLDIWEELKPFCELIEGEKIPWLIIGKNMITSGNRKSSLGLINFTPHNKPFLKITTVISYEGVGRKESECFLPMPIEKLEYIFSPYSLGWPPRNLFYKVSKACSFFSPHFKCTTWPQIYSAEDILLFTSMHRTGDFIGEMSLVDHIGFPAGAATTFIAGHKHADNLLKKVRESKKILPFQIIQEKETGVI